MNDETGAIVLDTEFQFSHLSEDKTKAIFNMDNLDDEYLTDIRSRLRSCVEEGDIVAPGHTVQIKYDLTDGPVPDMSIDYENLTMSCDWRQLLTIAYSEVQQTSKMTEAWVKSQEERIRALSAQAKSQEELMSLTMQAVTQFAASNNNGLKMARRARIKKQFKELGRDWNPVEEGNEEEEEELLKKLADFRMFISMNSLSDDGEDDSEEDEEEDQEDEEEDEWEDDL